MAGLYTVQTPNRNQDSRQLPTNYDNDRYTPMPDENFSEPVVDDRPIESSHPTSGGPPELYHLNADEDRSEPMRDDQPFQSTSPPMDDPYSPSRATGNAVPELYHLGPTNDDQPIPNRRPPSTFSSNNRVSPMPYQNSDPTEQGIVMFYIKNPDEPRQQSSTVRKTTFNDQPTYFDNQDRSSEPDNQPPEKVTMFVLAAPERENLPPPFTAQQRTPSPPIHRTKKQQQQPAVAYDIMDDDNSNKNYAVPPKRRPFPTALNDVSTNIRYAPLSPSKASESIQRSMNKYRFGGN